LSLLITLGWVYITVPATRLRSVVEPVNPGARVVYLVNLVSVPQDPFAAVTNNKVLPEQGGSPLTSLLLLAARNIEQEEEKEEEGGGEDSLVSVR